jgi:hypothetical protein
MRPSWFHSHEYDDDGEDTDFEEEEPEVKVKKSKKDKQEGQEISKGDNVVDSDLRDPDKGERGVG